ncbi:MAG: ATP-binding protein [Planctomycetes bacterium]|nr:ATP-binding protein [Planctomycetota bacterium]
MSKSTRSPDHAVLVTTYDELDRLLNAFAKGHLPLLILLGTPGVGKSRAVSRALPEPTAGWISGNASAFGLYCATYEHRNKPLVIDDVDSLYSDRAAVRLLKGLCQTDLLKTVGWHTDAKTLERDEIPKSFPTTSVVCLIANEWRTTSVNVAAIEDRGFVVNFQPDALEVHRTAASWFWDQEVHDFIGENLGLLDGPHSYRTYTAAAQFKQGGLDWREMTLSRWAMPTRVAAVVLLKRDTSFKNEEARAKAFVTQGHGCRATYFNLTKTLKGRTSTATRFVVAGSPPAVPKPPTSDSVVEAVPETIPFEAVAAA